jgi:hypothetical protein
MIYIYMIYIYITNIFLPSPWTSPFLQFLSPLGHGSQLLYGLRTQMHCEALGAGRWDLWVLGTGHLAIGNLKIEILNFIGHLWQKLIQFVDFWIFLTVPGLIPRYFLWYFLDPPRDMLWLSLWQPAWYQKSKPHRAKSVCRLRNDGMLVFWFLRMLSC